MAPKKLKKGNDLRSKERTISIQKTTPAPIVEKKLKKAKKILAVLDIATVTPPAMLSALQENSESKKKKKKKHKMKISSDANLDGGAIKSPPMISELQKAVLVVPTMQSPSMISAPQENSKNKRKKKNHKMKISSDANLDIGGIKSPSTISELQATVFDVPAMQSPPMTSVPQENSKNKKKRKRNHNKEIFTPKSPPMTSDLQDAVLGIPTMQSTPTISAPQENKTPTKKNKKLKKIINTDAVLDAATIKSPSIFSALQENSKHKKKDTNKSNDANNVPLRKFFDSVTNVNGLAECETLTNTKSFFKPEILKPEECVIQFAKPCISPKQPAYVDFSKGNEHTSNVEQQSSIAGEFNGKRPAEKFDMEMNIKEQNQAASFNFYGGNKNTASSGRQSFGTGYVNGTEQVGNLDMEVSMEENKQAANLNYSGRNGDTASNGRQSFDADNVNDTRRAKESDLDMNTEDNYRITSENEDRIDADDPFFGENDLQFNKLGKNKFLVVMRHNKDFYLRGQLDVRVLYGAVEILGWCANDTSNKSYTVYSPRGCSLLCLEPLKHSSENLGQLEEKLTALGADSKLVEEFSSKLDDTSSLVLFEKSESTLVSFLGKHVPSISLYPMSLKSTNQLEITLNCQIRANTIYGHCHEKSEEWEQLAEDIADDFQNKGEARAVVCGGKGTGKSTLLRFLMNRNISAHGEVLYIDFDIGQPEFTVPGCVYAIRVTEPVLGPNYTHIRTPDRSVYIGQVNVDNCPERYIEGVKQIIEYCHSIPELRKMVWLINTMGYVHDLGAELNASIIGLTDPTRVVETVSLHRARNFRVPMLPEDVLELLVRWCKPPAQLNFKLFQMHSLSEMDGKSARGLQAGLLRNFMILAYFHTILGASKKYLSDVIPYRTPLSSLTLSILYETPLPGDVLNVMNGMLVALCKVDSDVDVLTPDDATLPRVLFKPSSCPCLGFGVVRGIDLQSRTLYLTTPIPTSSLSTVNCLTAGAVPLPPTLLLNPKVVSGVVPYVVTGPGQVTSRLVAKKYVAPRNRR